MIAKISLIIAAYLLGCIQTAYYLVKILKGKDIREIGSKNAGASNAARVLGKKGFIITFAGDASKGIIALLFARWLNFGEVMQLIVIGAAVIGHIYPFQLGFKGGKGASTFGGAILVYNIWFILYILPVFVVLMIITRKFTLSGLAMAVFMPLPAYFLGYSLQVVFVLAALIVFLLWAHRKNLKEYYETYFNNKNETEKH